jgi:putative two-component system response regulator
VAAINNEMRTHFDPNVREIFVENEKEFKNIRDGTGENYIQDGEGVNWESVSHAVTAILDARNRMDNVQKDRIQRYLTIFINELLKHKSYRDEVASWNLNVFMLAAQLHDVGKLSVSDSILHKDEKLTEMEYEHMKAHANYGVEVVRQISDSVDEGSLFYHAEALTGSHHEKWDGSGYPKGLKGKNIPLQARLMAIVDVYDAVTNDRSDRKKIHHTEAVKLIQSLSGTSFDPELVEVFNSCEKMFSLEAIEIIL